MGWSTVAAEPDLLMLCAGEFLQISYDFDQSLIKVNIFSSSQLCFDEAVHVIIQSYVRPRGGVP